MLYFNMRYQIGRETITLAIRSDHRFQPPIYDNFMEIIRTMGTVNHLVVNNFNFNFNFKSLVPDLALDDWEFIIVRSIMDLNHDESHIYQAHELSEPEIVLLSSVAANTIRVACHIAGDNTSLIYSVL